jgi:hypothetical protein
VLVQQRSTIRRRSPAALRNAGASVCAGARRPIGKLSAGITPHQINQGTLKLRIDPDEEPAPLNPLIL